METLNQTLQYEAVESDYKINGRTREGKLIKQKLNEVGATTEIVYVKYSYGKEIGFRSTWDKDTMINLAKKINYERTNDSLRAERIDVVVTEVIQDANKEYPSFVGYWTVSDEPKYRTKTRIGYSYSSDSVTKYLFGEGQFNNLNKILGELLAEAKRKAEHLAKREEAKATAVISDSDAYRIRSAERKLGSVVKSLENPLTAETTPTDLIERAKQLLMKQLLELVINNVGKLNCERKFASSEYDLDKYAMVTVKDVVLYIASDWKSSDWSETLLDAAAKKEVIDALRW
jgi:hypothetical protein